MVILEYLKIFFYNVYFAFLYLAGFTNSTPFVLKNEQQSPGEVASCSDVRQSNTCTQSFRTGGVAEGDTKCDYKWDRILSTRRVTRTYADAFPGLARKTCSAPS